MITLEDISFSYRKGSEAVSGASASLEPGIYLLAGENGAGKTTLMHLMAGLLKPASGRCLLDGQPVWPRRPDTQRRSFFLPDTMDVPLHDFADMARLHGCFFPDFSRADMNEALAAFGLDENMSIKRMSLGMRRKALAAYSLALHVPLLLLDEPANGLDITARKELRRLLASMTGMEQTVIVSTHTVHDFEQLFDGLLLLSEGRLLLCRKAWEITARISFVAADRPLPDALYQEPDGPMFRALVKADDGVETPIDYSLLYSAIMSPSRDKILNLLNE